MNARYMLDIWLVFLFKQDQFSSANDLFATSTTSLFIVIAAYSGEHSARSLKSAACVVILYQSSSALERRKYGQHDQCAQISLVYTICLYLTKRKRMNI